MRKKEYKKLVEELQAEVLKLKEELKPLIERQLLQDHYVASWMVSKKQEKTIKECPNCKEETYIKFHETIAPRCYSCNYPHPTQSSIEKWIGKSK
jgi:hypothetical protein